MSLTHALLGLLADRPRSGYELTKAIDADLGRHAWQAGHASVYPELNRLAGEDLIEVTHEGARGSRTYVLTPAGRAELRSWLITPPRNGGRVRNEQVLRMFLLSALDSTDALVVLREIAEQAAAEIVDLRGSWADADERAGTGAADVRALATEFGLRQYEAVHGWAVWAIERFAAAEQAGLDP